MIKIKGSSKELQEVSLIALINDPYLMSKCMEAVNENYFVDPAYKLIYKCLKIYYSKYMVLPSQRELHMVISDNYNEDYGDLENVISAMKRLYSAEVSSEDFMYESLIEFIKRNKIENSMSNVINYIKKTGEVDLDYVADELISSTRIDLSRAETFNLADVSQLKSIRQEALGCNDNTSPVIVKFFIDDVNKAFQYKGLIPGTLNMVTAPPGRGKTTMLINQGVSTALQGYRLLHVFLGDMSRLDGLLRYLSCFTGVPTSKLVELSDSELEKFIQKYNMSGCLSNVDIVSYAADEVSASQLIENIKTFQRRNRCHYNVIIIDYDENLSTEEEDNMYKSGGQIYNKIALFSVINKSVIFIASQPKTEFWKLEVIPLEAASESSKKQKIIDLMLTLGKPSNTSSVGTLYIAKNRRGEGSKVFRLNIDGDNAKMTHITEDEYNKLKQSEKSSSK